MNKKGKVTAVAQGTCYVYVYAQNGISAKVKVTVEWQQEDDLFVRGGQGTVLRLNMSQ